MKFITLMIITLFLFVGCSTSSLVFHNDKNLLLKYDSNSILLSNTIEESKSLNYKDLFVTIYKLKDKNGRVVFYEDAKTELNFEFNFSELYTVMYIFDDAQKYEELYRKNNLSFVQIKLKDNNYLNVIIQASDTQEYSYAYGFSNDEFLKLAKSASLNDKEKSFRLKYKAITLDADSKPLSNWNDKLVYFTPLITPLRIMGRF